MVRRNGLVFLGLGLLSGALIVGTGVAGCQNDTTTSGPGSGGSGGSGGTGGTHMTGGSTSSGNPTSSSSGTGGTGGSAQVVTIEAVTTNQVGPDLPVKLQGVVAMSQKFLVSKGSQSGSCLWGVFVSSPGISETKENSGILVVSYGTNAVIPDGGNTAFCPKLGSEPIGDAIPDGTKPGDVLEFVGETSYFLLSQCATQPMGSTVAQYQIAKTSSVTKTGTAAVPAAHEFTGADLALIGSPTDKAFHDKWGGVKVKVSNATVVAQGGMVVGMFGIITLNLGNGATVNVADKIYYQAYNQAALCHSGPVYTDVNMTFTSVEGFNYLNFCTWDLEPNTKCDDLKPASEDCAGASCN